MEGLNLLPPWWDKAGEQALLWARPSAPKQEHIKAPAPAPTPTPTPTAKAVSQDFPRRPGSEAQTLMAPSGKGCLPQPA